MHFINCHIQPEASEELNRVKELLLLSPSELIKDLRADKALKVLNDKLNTDVSGSANSSTY